MWIKVQMSVNRDAASALEALAQPQGQRPPCSSQRHEKAPAGLTGPGSGLRVGGRTGPKHRRTPTHQHTLILTHKQDCVTASKIRPVAPGSLSLFHGGSRLQEPLHPFRVVRTVFLCYATRLRKLLHLRGARWIAGPM